MRRDDRNTLRLSGKTEKFLVPGRIAFANGGEVLILVAEEQDLAEVACGMVLHFGNAVEDGALEIKLHHDAQSLRESGVHANRKIQSGDAAIFNQPAKRRQPGVWTFSGHLLIAQPERYAGQLLKDFMPRSNFLLSFPPATAGRKPQGFSGSGVWYQRKTPKTKLWFPKLVLLGLCTSYYDRSQLLCALRIERILTFLQQFGA